MSTQTSELYTELERKTINAMKKHEIVHLAAVSTVQTMAKMGGEDNNNWFVALKASIPAIMQLYTLATAVQERDNSHYWGYRQVSAITIALMVEQSWGVSQ